MRTVNFYLIVAGALALSACQTTTQPGIEVRTVEVPVPMPCLPADQIPPEPPQIRAQLAGKSAAEALVIVAASALELRAWGQELAAAHRACGGG